MINCRCKTTHRNEVLQQNTAKNIYLKTTELEKIFAFLGFCLKVVVDFCIYHRVPYNHTRFPSRLHVNQAGPKQVNKLIIPIGF